MPWSRRPQLNVNTEESVARRRKTAQAWGGHLRVTARLMCRLKLAEILVVFASLDKVSFRIVTAESQHGMSVCRTLSFHFSARQLFARVRDAIGRR